MQCYFAPSGEPAEVSLKLSQTRGILGNTTFAREQTVGTSGGVKRMRCENKAAASMSAWLRLSSMELSCQVLRLPHFDLVVGNSEKEYWQRSFLAACISNLVFSRVPVLETDCSGSKPVLTSNTWLTTLALHMFLLDTLKKRCIFGI